jgi:MFS family permease
MRGLYFSGFFIAAGIALFRLKYLRETIENPKVFNFNSSNVFSIITDAYRSVLNVLNEIPRRLWTLSLIVSISIFFASFTSGFWVIRATEVIGLSVGEWGNVMLVSGIVSVILGIPAGNVVDRFNKKLIAGACLIIGSIQCLLFLKCTTYTQVVLLAAFMTLTNSFLNPAFQSLFANMTPREQRGRVLASIGGGGIWLMRGAFGSGVLGRLLQTVGSLLSGYIYKINGELPWQILSGALALFGVLFLALVQEPKKAEI